METSANCRNIDIMKKISTVLMGVEGFLLFFSHINGGDGSLIILGMRPLYIGIPVAITLLSIGFGLRDRRNAKVEFAITQIAILLYLILRIVSAVSNGVLDTQAFINSICYEIFLLEGVSVYTVDSRTVRIVFCELFAFTLITISICMYGYMRLPDIMTSAVSSLDVDNQSYLPFTYIFSNPNPAGMLAGINAVACTLIFIKSNKSRRLALIPVITISLVFMIWSFSRTAMVGTLIMTVIILIAIVRRKKINYKRLFAISLSICIALLIPVYIQTLSGEENKELSNNEIEFEINTISSGRYNIWKEHILSERGHFMLGFGTASNAVKARVDYLTEKGMDGSDNEDNTYHALGSNTTLGVHNGYLELLLTAGIPAAFIVFTILFFKIRKINNEFVSRHILMLLLVMLFWISVMESRFVTSSVPYIAFLMMLLLNWREDEEIT